VRPVGGGGSAWMGDIHFDSRNGGLAVATLIAPTWPAYAAGLEEDDQLRQIDGQRVATDADVRLALAKHRPGDTIGVVFTDRAGRTASGKMTLAANPHVEVVAIESSGGTLTGAQRAFRDRWLGAK
jgi:S1-C subfamily serine protease